MRRGPAVILAGLLVSLGGMWIGGTSLSACALDQGGTAIGEAGPDQTSEAAPPDAGPDAPATEGGDGAACPVASCSGECVANCDGCKAGIFLCLSTRACGDCASCPSEGIQCAGCGTVAICRGSASQCPTGAGACPCSNDPGTCVGATQVCVSGECRTCGANDTNDATCKNGKKCEESASQCK